MLFDCSCIMETPAPASYNNSSAIWSWTATGYSVIARVCGVVWMLWWRDVTLCNAVTIISGHNNNSNTQPACWWWWAAVDRSQATTQSQKSHNIKLVRDDTLWQRRELPQPLWCNLICDQVTTIESICLWLPMVGMSVDNSDRMSMNAECKYNCTQN